MVTEAADRGRLEQDLADHCPNREAKRQRQQYAVRTERVPFTGGCSIPAGGRREIGGA